MTIVTVIIPTYNRCETLKKAIKSVFEQTFQDFEIVVVDDGSTDQTSAYLSTLKDRRFHYVRFATNRGANQARNEGIKNSNCSFVAFLDDDDRWAPTKLEKQINVIREYDVDLCYSGFNLFTRKKKLTKYIYYRQRYSDLYKSIMYDNFLCSTSSILVKKELVEQVGCFDPNLSALQDYDLFIRLISNGCRIKGIDEPLVNYYIIDENRSISCSLSNYKNAAEYICHKYREAQYINLLRRRLKIIEIKRLFKSKRFLYDSIKLYSQRLFNFILNK